MASRTTIVPIPPAVIRPADLIKQLQALPEGAMVTGIEELSWQFDPKPTIGNLGLLGDPKLPTQRMRMIGVLAKGYPIHWMWAPVESRSDQE
jgi:hypothetical protein